MSNTKRIMIISSILLGLALFIAGTSIVYGILNDSRTAFLQDLEEGVKQRRIHNTLPIKSISGTDLTTAVFNETELQIRIHSYNYTKRMGSDYVKPNPNHKDITVDDFKAQLGQEDSWLVQDFMNWWGKCEGRDDYRVMLIDVHEDYKKNILSSMEKN